MQEVFEKIKQRITIAATEACGYSALTRVISESELKDILESTYSEFNDGWIPCSERLPEESGTYIVNAIENHIVHVTFAKFMPRMKKWNLTGSRSYWKVTAWTPLPEPYKPDSVDTEKPEWKDRMMQTFLGGRR
ncbi:DUF551 domain-containing protein [Frisingicoccus sp.]|uniref:DUF551 domain-containing protein n=1 Tax=Frisingicoccus sp. TaxID=1918627 RepID=UPI0025C11DDA|nr:DUF551 domain-containing protein [Frisingicoccus sp.]